MMLFSLQFAVASIAQCKQKFNMRQRYWQTRNRILVEVLVVECQRVT